METTTTTPVENPIDMFIEGTKERQEGRVYITFVDMPFPVMVKGTIVIVRRRVLLDVTGESVNPESSQADIGHWVENPAIQARLAPGILALHHYITNEPSFAEEAEAYKDHAESRGNPGMSLGDWMAKEGISLDE